jgi:hypothetical protein
MPAFFMKLNEIYMNKRDSTKRVKIIRLDEKSFTIETLDKTYKKTFRTKIQKEVFLSFFILIPKLLLELD